jgi:hypothetical protein
VLASPAADGVHGQLLHRSVDRRGEHLLRHFARGLDGIFGQLCGFLLRIGEVT